MSLLMMFGIGFVALGLVVYALLTPHRSKRRRATEELFGRAKAATSTYVSSGGSSGNQRDMERGLEDLKTQLRPSTPLDWLEIIGKLSLIVGILLVVVAFIARWFAS
jgi:Flp pilus assembly protein TadB